MAGSTDGGREVLRKVPLAYLVFLLFAYVLTGVLLVLLAFLLYQFRLSSKAVSVGVVLIYVASTFLAGYLAGKKAKNKKYVWGFVMGVGYFLVLAAVSLLTNSADGSLGGVTSFLLCAAGGTLGGMLS